MKVHTDLKMRKFDRIIFNFPHAGFYGKEDNSHLIRMHKKLLDGFFRLEPKPIYEDTVLATRKQIESRNPLAFAPKVIRNSDSIIEIGEESSKTPASARHKRGCNCKKSGCLKKYCECYQGGVGCSINCRCEGCKNAFGKKDGTEVELGEEEEAKHENSAVNSSLQITTI